MLDEEMGVKLIAVEVFHVQQAFAPILIFKDFGKVVFSGDCRPSQNLINYA